MKINRTDMTIPDYLELLKLRISGMITLTSFVAYLAVAETVELGHLFFLGLAMMLGAASSAVFNHWFDRDIDRTMERTAQRPLARGAMANPSNALWLAGGLLIAGVGLGVWRFNAITGLHIFLGAFFYGVVYTAWLKRRTWLNIILGGFSGSFAVLAGTSSVHPEAAPLPLYLALLLFLWTPSHFWSLAIHLKDEYRRANVPMLPVVAGEQRAAWAIFINSVLLIWASLLPWFQGELGLSYLFGVSLAGILFLGSNLRLLKRPTRLAGWQNFIGSMRYLGIVFVAIVMDVNL